MADSSFTCLHSARLTLRRLREDDLAYLCAYRSRPEVARYQDWECFTPADGERLLAAQAGLFPDVPGTWFQLGIELTATAALVGDCGLHCRSDNLRQAEVGITLAPEQHGQGYATEALTCLLDYAFLGLHKHRVTAIVDAENIPAARLLERIGLRREGHFLQNVWFKGRWGDEYLYAVLHSEWSRTRQS
jgi:RimJ/RimL family protein N-acetyltransferase